MNINRKSRSKRYSVPMTVFLGLIAIFVFGASAGADEDTATSRSEASSPPPVDSNRSDLDWSQSIKHNVSNYIRK